VKIICLQSEEKTSRQVSLAFRQPFHSYEKSDSWQMSEVRNSKRACFFTDASAGKDVRMSYTKRALKELNLLDDFLMGAVASNEEIGPEFCRIVLSTFLERKIGTVKVIAQRTIPAISPELRGIRMDVEVTESQETSEELPAMNIYDIEPHIPKDGNLPRRNRFYQAKVDGRNMPGGTEDFYRLPNLYVITITPYDPFGYDYMMYTVRNKCEEVPAMNYEDGLQFIYLNPEGTQGGSSDIREMLYYFQNSREENATNESLKKIHGYVNKVKILPEVEKDYMKFEEIVYYERKEAAEEAYREQRLEDIWELLEDYGELPGEIKEQMEQEKSGDILKKWHKLAARSKSMEEFIQNM